MTDPLTLSVVTILGNYVVDAGVKLAKEAGPPAAKKAAELAKVALGYLRGKPDGKVIADSFEAKPDVYDKALTDQLETAFQSDPAFKEQLAGLLAEYKAEETSYQATLTGSGAIAQGPGATAVGERGAYVGGSAGVVITGDSNTVSAGGDIVGGDKVEGDKIGGDRISVGDISGSGIAIGRGASATVSQGLSGGDLNALFAPLLAAVKAAPAEKREAATGAVEALQQEAAKGDQADDNRMGRLVDRLLKLVPQTAGALKEIFTSPTMAKIAGPVTTFVLEQIEG